MENEPVIDNTIELTEAEKATILWMTKSSPETLERIAEEKRLNFVRWLYENNRITDYPNVEE